MKILIFACHFVATAYAGKKIIHAILKVYRDKSFSCVFLNFQGISRHKEKYYDESVVFIKRHFINCSILHRNALAARTAHLDRQFYYG